jgi:hypothetical protein
LGKEGDKNTEEVERFLRDLEPLEIKLISDENAKLFLRRLKGHLKGIGKAVEDFLLSSAAVPGRRQRDGHDVK